MRRASVVYVLAMGSGGASALVGLFACQGKTAVTNVNGTTPEPGQEGAAEAGRDSSGNDAGELDAIAYDGPQNALEASSVQTCDAGTDVCAPTCGDGVVMAPDGGTCSQRDTACDMTGYWAARETNYTQDTVIGSIQASSTWTLFHFEQTGNDFRVVEDLDCGEHVTGSATIDFTQAALVANMYLNRQDGVADDAGVVHPARHGTSQQVAGGCAITFDRWYKIRGALDSYLPADFSTKPALASLPALPAVMSAAPTSTEWPMGATDPDGDGIPGIAYQVSGLLSGVRNAVWREWKDFATRSDAPVPAYALRLVVPDGYDVQESVMRVTQCGSGCDLIAAGSHAVPDLPGTLTLSFIGKTLGSSRVAPVVVGVPRQNPDLDQTTCASVRALLPHDPSVPSPSDAGFSGD